MLSRVNLLFIHRNTVNAPDVIYSSEQSQSHLLCALNSVSFENLAHWKIITLSNRSTITDGKASFLNAYLV